MAISRLTARPLSFLAQLLQPQLYLIRQMGRHTCRCQHYFFSTLNGATALTLNGGVGGTVSFGGAVGGITPLTSLTATGFTVTQSSTAKTTGALSYTGSTAINVGGNITTSGSPITMTGTCAMSGNPIFDTTNGGAVPAGANISFSNTLDGSTSLTLRAGTAEIQFFSGAIGGLIL
jgi:hypothetical protein